MLAWAVIVLAAGAAAEKPSREVGIPTGKGAQTPVVTLSAPAGWWTVDRMLLVEGRVSDPTVDPVQVSVNGDRYLLRTADGRFSRRFPAASGRNVVVVTATNRGGTGSAQASGYARVPGVPLKAVLTSDMDGVYTDLHVYEPTRDTVRPNGSFDPSKMQHVWWLHTASPSGGTLLLNEQNGDFDQPGYGPYLYVHRAPQKGLYLFATNYWPSGDKPHTVAMLDLTVFEGTAGELRRRVRAPLATPGTTRVLAWVAIADAQKATVYVPGQDPEPSGPPWPRDFRGVAAAILKQVDSGMGE